MGAIRKTASMPPRSTAAKLRQSSLERSRELLKNGIPEGLSDFDRRVAESEYKVAKYRQRNGLL
ncbi:hypothetical protein [Neisseria dumasiana]|uniref:Uncharacterized protein n=1 Tax=Neisseria dumasiana TaxID=1931275 RepID=A0A1X3DIM2_9NEIS|nr:hypothetical protein [Neisseria dumasiana]OSI20389.1 hypothetical protein BV912_07405 [Neisseria dumasiana]